MVCENKNECPCPEEDCPRHGICCQCVMYHRNTNILPACLRE